MAGPLTVNGGTVDLAADLAVNTYAYTGAAVTVNGGTFNLTGGTVEGFLIINGGAARGSGGAVTGPVQAYDGGVVIINGGAFDLDGCTIRGTGSSPAVIVGAGGAFGMSSGYVYGFAAPAIDNTAGGTAVYTGGTVSSNTTPAVAGPILDAPGGNPADI
jgi:hypothetical protein